MAVNLMSNVPLILQGLLLSGKFPPFNDLLKTAGGMMPGAQTSSHAWHGEPTECGQAPEGRNTPPCVTPCMSSDDCAGLDTRVIEEGTVVTMCPGHRQDPELNVSIFGPATVRNVLCCVYETYVAVVS